MKATEHKNII